MSQKYRYKKVYHKQNAGFWFALIAVVCMVIGLTGVTFGLMETPSEIVLFSWIAMLVGNSGVVIHTFKVTKKRVPLSEAEKLLSD